MGTASGGQSRVCHGGARIYPTVKYAMGHGKACTRIVVGGTPIGFDRTPVATLQRG